MSGWRRAAALLIVLGSAAALGCATGGGSKSVAVNESDTYARQLMVRRCQGCHRVPRPENRTQLAWGKALTRMKLLVTLPASDWDSLATLGRIDSTAAAIR